MSKKTWLLIILVGITGVAIGIITKWNPIATIQSFIQNPLIILEWTQPLLKFIEQNIVGSIIGLASGIGLAAKAVQNIRQSGKQTIETL